MKSVDPLSVPSLRHLWYRYYIYLAPKSDKGVTIVLGNSTTDVERAMEQSSGIWMQSKRVVGNKFGSSPYEVQCTGVKVMSDKTLDLSGNNFTLIFDKSKGRVVHLELFTSTTISSLVCLTPYMTNTRSLHTRDDKSILMQN